MPLYVDTSAFLAVLVGNDLNHARAREAWSQACDSREVLVCANYVLLETLALLQRRVGLDAVFAFEEDVLPLLRVHWVDERIHRAGMDALRTTRRRDVSLVDCVSFECMRLAGLKSAFAFDPHFREQGFEVVPLPDK